MQRLVGGYYEIATNPADREEPLEFDYDKMLMYIDHQLFIGCGIILPQLQGRPKTNTQSLLM